MAPPPYSVPIQGAIGATQGFGDPPLCINAVTGPFRINGNLYALTTNFFDQCYMQKEVFEAGSAIWSSLDNANTNRPKSTAAGGSFSCGVALTPSKNFLYVLWAYATGTDGNGITFTKLALSRFNFSTETWDQKTLYNNIITYDGSIITPNFYSAILGVPNAGTTTSDSRQGIFVYAGPYLVATSDTDLVAIMQPAIVQISGTHWETSIGWSNLTADVSPTVFRPSGNVTATTFVSMSLDGLIAAPSGNVYALTSAFAFLNFASPPGGATTPDSIGRQWQIISGPNAGLSGNLSTDVFYMNNGFGPTCFASGGLMPALTPGFLHGMSYGGVGCAIQAGGVDVVVIPCQNGSGVACADVITNFVAAREVLPGGNVTTWRYGLSGGPQYQFMSMQAVLESGKITMYFIVGKPGNQAAQVTAPTDIMRSVRTAGIWSSPVVWFHLTGANGARGAFLNVLYDPSGGLDRWEFQTQNPSDSDARFYSTGLVAPINPPVTLACPTKNTALIGVPYSSGFITSGGTAPFTFAIIAGSLPPGLTLNTSTGVISGTPTGHGTFAYTGQVTDSAASTATASCSIFIPIFAQLIFQGVRRQKGKRPELIDETACYRPKPLTLVQQFQITTTGTFPAELQSAGPTRIIQTIYDYPFQWEELEITFSSSGTLPEVVMALMLYDPVKLQMANLPVEDIFLNGAPLSEYRNGSQVPPLIFPVNGEIQVDVWSLVADSSILPITVTLHFVGKRLIPA